jgi:glycosyltransferase involved in cell wall biosynthesis
MEQTSAKKILPLGVHWSGRGSGVDVSVVVYVDDHLDSAAQLYGYVANDLMENGRSFEFLFIDDGNHEKILAEMEGFQGVVRNTKILRFSRPFGPSTAMSAGFRHARGRWILTLGPFLQVEPGQIRHMFKKIEEGYDFVNGWRVRRTDSRLNQIHSRLYNGLIRWVSRVPLHDTNCTLKLFKREILEDLPMYGDMYRFLPVLAAQRGFLVGEVPVRQRTEINRLGIYSAATYLRRFLDLVALFFLGRFTLTPLRFFGSVGAFLFFGGFLINLYLTYIKMAHGQPIADRPLLLLGTLLIVVGVQTATVGLLGELMIFTQVRQIKDPPIEKIVE